MLDWVSTYQNKEDLVFGHWMIYIIMPRSRSIAGELGLAGVNLICIRQNKTIQDPESKAMIG